jgi:hypothetical protein
LWEKAYGQLQLLAQEIHALRLRIENIPTAGQNRFGSTPFIPTTVSGSALQKENDLFDEVVSGSHPIGPPDELK